MKLTTKAVLAFLLLLVLGIAYAQNTKPASPPANQGNISTPSGRYQIVTSSVTARNTFLLDTQTGRVWQLTQFTDVENEPTAWMIQTRLDSEFEKVKWAVTQGIKKTP